MKILVSKSPDNKTYKYGIDWQAEKKKIDAFLNRRPTVGFTIFIKKPILFFDDR